MGRYVGLDVGEARTGIAVSDALGMMALPHDVLRCASPGEDARVLAAMAKELGAVGIVVGVPLNQHGEVGPQAEKVLAFVEALRAATELPVDTIDERFTTALVQRSMHETGVRGKKRKGMVDALAAQQILQTYLDRRANQRKSQS